VTGGGRPVSGRWFEQLPVGTTVQHVTRRTVTETDNVLFTTMTMNPAPMHLDAEYAARSEFGRPLANSMFTAALVVGISVPELTLLTFAQAWARGVRPANALRALGVGPGDRVAGVEDNNLGAADLFIGCAIAGAVRVPLYARNARGSHGHMLAQTAAKVVLADAAYSGTVTGLEKEIPTLDQVVVRDAGYEDWLAAQPGTDPMVEVGPDDWYVIRHSAGTTGRPKGVGYTQHDWLVNCRNWFYRLAPLRMSSVVGHAARGR
jgi:acyl-coenzyme A synthetase/AMP-(fatty) acid ligase